MKKKIDGFQEAIKMLQHLDLDSQQSLLVEIARKDPEMALKLKENLITFDDLKELTPEMASKLLRNISLPDLGLALRGVGKETVQHLVSMLSSNMKAEVEEVLLGKPRPLSEVLEAQRKVMKVVFQLIQKGEIVFLKS